MGYQDAMYHLALIISPRGITNLAASVHAEQSSDTRQIARQLAVTHKYRIMQVIEGIRSAIGIVMAISYRAPELCHVNLLLICLDMGGCPRDVFVLSNEVITAQRLRSGHCVRVLLKSGRQSEECFAHGYDTSA
jgi:hypothetical protein